MTVFMLGEQPTYVTSVSKGYHSHRLPTTLRAGALSNVRPQSAAAAAQQLTVSVLRALVQRVQSAGAKSGTRRVRTKSTLWRGLLAGQPVSKMDKEALVSLVTKLHDATAEGELSCKDMYTAVLNT